MQVQEVNKRVDRKIEKVEENILQWIDEEAKAIRSTVERDLGSLREEVDSKNIEMLSKVGYFLSVKITTVFLNLVRLRLVSFYKNLFATSIE
jgi:hypothetical protein